MIERRAFLESVAALTAFGVVKAKGKRFIGDELPEAKVGQEVSYEAAVETTPVEMHPRIFLGYEGREEIELTNSVQSISVETETERTTGFGDQWESEMPTGRINVEIEGIDTGVDSPLRRVNPMDMAPMRLRILLPHGAMVGLVRPVHTYQEQEVGGLMKWRMTMTAMAPLEEV